MQRCRALLLALLAATLPVATVPAGGGGARRMLRPTAHARALPVMLRCRGGADLGEVGEAEWQRRMAEWEGEDSAPTPMRDDGESSQSGSATPPAPVDSPGDADAWEGSSSHIMGDSSAEGADADGSPPTRGAPIGSAGAAAVQDAGLERARRASVIQELLSMGADLRRAGLLSVFNKIAGPRSTDDSDTGY